MWRAVLHPCLYTGVLCCICAYALAELHDPDDEPISDELFDFDFEKGELSEAQIRELIYRDVVEFQQQVAEQGTRVHAHAHACKCTACACTHTCIARAHARMRARPCTHTHVNTPTHAHSCPALVWVGLQLLQQEAEEQAKEHEKA